MNVKRLSSYLVSTLLVALLMTSCGSISMLSEQSGLSESYLNQIPKDSELIIVEKSVSADELFAEIYDILIERGHRITNHNNERHYLTTEGKKLTDKILQRMTINVSEKGGVSKLSIRTEWQGMGYSMYGKVISEWYVGKMKPDASGVAFAESVVIAKKIKDGKISYE